MLLVVLLALALKFLRSQNLIHRDIKPQVSDLRACRLRGGSVFVLTFLLLLSSRTCFFNPRRLLRSLLVILSGFRSSRSPTLGSLGSWRERAWLRRFVDHRESFFFLLLSTSFEEVD